MTPARRRFVEANRSWVHAADDGTYAYWIPGHAWQKFAPSPDVLAKFSAAVDLRTHPAAIAASVDGREVKRWTVKAQLAALLWRDSMTRGPGGLDPEPVLAYVPAITRDEAAADERFGGAAPEKIYGRVKNY